MIVENDGLESLRQTTSKILVAALWLHVPISVTVGLAISFMLEDTGMVSTALGDAPPVHDHPYRTLAQQQTQVRLQEAVAHLPLREQKIIRYHYFHRLNFEHIADILNLSKGRVSQLHRSALNELRRRIGTIDDFYLLA